MSPVLRAISKSAYVLLALGLVVAGCDCGDEGLTPNCDCLSDDMCASMPASCEASHSALGENAFCNLETKRCFQDKFECDPAASNDGDCCPGQLCSSLAGLCTNKYTTCTEEEACVVKGQVCKPLGTPAGDPGCTFERCGAEGACAEGLSCFNGFCVGEAPCNGGCAEGQVCVPAANRCFRPGELPEWPASCEQSCEPGTVLVFVDGTNVFDRCDRSVEARACQCEALPPLEARDMARHSSSAAAGGKVFVSAYDADHGDLVVHTFDASGTKEKTEWVDGIPASGAVIADPNGPRGGRATPGEDVGQYTSIATDGTVLHVAYYAVKDGTTTLGDLRYARRSATGEWTIHVVDGRTGGADTSDVGLYTSVALNDAGVPYISYFQRGGFGADASKTALKVARAKKKDPSSAADWDFDVVAEGTRQPPPCSSPACTADEVCTDAPSAPNGLCRTKASSASDCDPKCGGAEACAIGNDGKAACFPSLRASTLASLPEGNGLFSSLSFVDGKPVVVWYDENAGVLRGAVASGAGFALTDAKVLDDGTVPGAPAPHDVGRFASVAVAPAGAGKRLAVSYFDVTARQLKVLTANADLSDITAPDLRVADDGKGNPEVDPVLFVGADSSIAFDAAGGVVVAYQDATSGDLRIAKQQAGTSTFALSPLRTEGACGFYANLTKDGDKLFVSHAIIKAESSSKSANRLEVVAVP